MSTRFLERIFGSAVVVLRWLFADGGRQLRPVEAVVRSHILDFEQKRCKVWPRGSLQMRPESKQHRINRIGSMENSVQSCDRRLFCLNHLLVVRGTDYPCLVRHWRLGQAESKCRALADLALYPDLPSVQLDELLGQG
jgi:hypothetical protein